MRLSAQWLETYIICQALLAGAWTWLRRVRVDRAPQRKLWLARTVLLTAVLAPALFRFAQPSRGALLPAIVSLDEMPRLNLARVVETPRSTVVPAGGPKGSAWHDIDPLWLCWAVVLLGGLIHLSRTSRDLVRIHRLLRGTAALRIVGNARVVVSAECRVPFSVAWLKKAYVVLPTHMLARASYLRMAIAHEIQHHRQGDCWTAYVLELLRAAFFWNPCIHLWRSRLSELQEFSCDEVLIGPRLFEPYDYGRCLLAVAQAASQPIGSSPQDFACVVGMAQQSDTPASLLQRRIRMLSHYRSAAPRRTLVGALASAFMITALLGLAYAAQGTLTPRDVPALDLSHVHPGLQPIAEAEVKAALTQLKAKSVAVVVAQPRTGTIVAFAEAHSEPTAESWANRVFAPGSTTKPFVVAAALEAGVVSEDQALDCQSPYDVGGKAFHNHDGNRGLEKVSISEAMAQSVNVCTIKMAQATGKERVRHTLQQFGLDWKDEKASGGQELSADDVPAVLGVTLPASLPSMIRAYSILANHGRSLTPPSDQLISEKTTDAIVRMLVATVDHGTGKRAALPRMVVAGKTGTVSSPLEPKAGDANVTGMFGGFAPAEAPRLVAFVIVEDGVRQGQTGGGAVAAPIFREVMGKSLAALDQTVR